MEESKISENGDSRGQNGDVVVVIKDDNGDKMCRICHLSDDDDSTEDSELIKLGCDCRGELGLSHHNCADAWFSQKGNRECEICGKTAKNMSSNYDNVRLMMELSEIRLVVGAVERSNENTQRCKISLCNLLIGCLVIAFFLPWFFRGMDLVL